MKYLLIVMSLLARFMIPATTIAKDENEIPQTTVEGLKLIPGPRDIALVWAEPGANLSQYDRVYLTEIGLHAVASRTGEPGSGQAVDATLGRSAAQRPG